MKWKPIGTSLCGRALEVPNDQEPALFDTNCRGVAHGCRIAVPHLPPMAVGAAVGMAMLRARRAER